MHVGLTIAIEVARRIHARAHLVVAAIDRARVQVVAGRHHTGDAALRGVADLDAVAKHVVVAAREVGGNPTVPFG
ncbi:hypothetical protein D3C83_108360 [compost metagenome]